MIDEMNIRAARNNARLCDLVCCAQGRPGEFFDEIWINRRAVPRFYPNAVTLGERSSRQLELVDSLIDARLPGGWAIKDSFSTLDAASRGFRVLFEAQWICLPASSIQARAMANARWEIVKTDRALVEWESAWDAANDTDSRRERVFQRPILDDRDVAVVVAYRDDRIAAGAIANRSDDVVGWSNLFANAPDVLDCAAASLTTIAEAFPGLPIVGYANGEELRGALALGFKPIGPLRVWSSV